MHSVRRRALNSVLLEEKYILSIAIILFIYYSAVDVKTATIVMEDSDRTHPTPRLSFGQAPSEQLVSKHSMEVMSMDEELNNFRHNWHERRSIMLERHKKERESCGMNGEGSTY